MRLPRAPTVALALLAWAASAGAADLTASEQRWLQAGWPVVLYAKAQKLPLDIIVQPAAKRGEAPLAMGYRRGHCLLVLTMRGNPDTETALAGVEAGLQPAVVEAMFAHEIAHCWRHVKGAWQASGSRAGDPAGANGSALADARRRMREAQQEEAYADLVALAWTRERHPVRYAQVHAWLAQYRADQPVSGGHHDTRAWLDLAADPGVFDRGATLFDRAEPVWRAGLAGGAP